MKVTAAVVEELGAAFTLKTLELAAPGPDEVLIEVAGVGLCHTDLAVARGHLPFAFPAVLGHEGSGTVAAVGDAVTKVAPGDRVALTFSYCGGCAECAAGFPSYCVSFMELNFGGAATLHGGAGGTDVNGAFFGQSSFATHALVRAANVVQLPDGVPLELAGPLGCGIQTGAGAVLNSLNCPAGSSLLVTGGGSVGLSAVMAAAARGLATIIVAEPVPARRELALTLGATHAIDPAGGDLAGLVRAIRPEGVKHALDTTAAGPVITGVIASLAQQGRFGMVGVPTDLGATLTVGLVEMQARGLSFQGIVEGDSNPEVFIPQLAAMYQEGTFPFDKIITTVPFAKINDAVEAQRRGEIVKAVLVQA
ncbi:MAG TPA: NAD(P)-dependent alcohol dehydrogenase [Streptosporangiaceae bacterium]